MPDQEITLDVRVNGRTRFSARVVSPPVITQDETGHVLVSADVFAAEPPAVPKPRKAAKKDEPAEELASEGDLVVNFVAAEPDEDPFA